MVDERGGLGIFIALIKSNAYPSLSAWGLDRNAFVPETGDFTRNFPSSRADYEM